ncbi:MAG: T9SS type A sorting domain-containing protein, partial [Chlorobi bacterium]|nr:T9SS type A sorting domain-containing protein [Chlorobiota bacterium]
VGFAELLHSYEIPDIRFVNPDTAEMWTGTGDTIIWQVLNPDDGNPLYYSLDYSIDGGEIWEEISNGLTNTSFYWDFSHLNDSTVCFFRLTGSSIDGTLTETIFSDRVTVHVISGIDDHENNRNTLVYPNPSKGIFYIDSKNIRNITVMNISGNFILQKNVQHSVPGRMEIIDLSGEKPGIYILKVSDDKTSTTTKLILQKP